MKIDLGKNELIHFVGIGGIGMSGLALIMNELTKENTWEKNKLKLIELINEN